MSALVALEADEIEGKICVVDPTSYWETVELVMQTIIAQRWDLGAVDEAECLRTLNDGPVAVDAAVLQCALRRLSDTANAANALPALTKVTSVWKLDAARVRAASAELLLRKRCSSVPRSSAQGGWPRSRMGVQEFLEEWGLVTPGVSAVSESDLTQLRGIALVQGQEVLYMPSKEMVQLSAKV
jgi:hypothetical protein